jgi:hypothetical protein
LTHTDKVYEQWIAEHVVRMCADLTDFAWPRDEELGVDWGFAFSVCRDETDAEKTRYARTAASMMKKYPDDIVDVRNRHWAVGWIDQLCVRMLDEEGKITKAGRDAVRRIARRIADGDVDLAQSLLEELHGALEAPRVAPASIAYGVPA